MPAAKPSAPTHPSEANPVNAGELALTVVEARQLFLKNIDLIGKLVSAVCRRRSLAGADAEDLASNVFLKLISDDYRALRQFRGRAKLSTYLATLIERELQDWRTRKWGRWRPSSQAKRLGSAAVELETLLDRDGHSLVKAIEILGTRPGNSHARSREVLERLAAQLPPRTKRRFEGEEALLAIPVDGQVERTLLQDSCRRQAAGLRRVLETAFSLLSTEDRAVLRLHFQHGMTLQAVATALHLEPRRVYRRQERSLGVLRRACEEAGLTWGEVEGILRWKMLDLDTIGYRPIASQGAS